MALGATSPIFHLTLSGNSVTFPSVYDALMLTWTQQKPSTPGWYWMLDPSKEPNLPTIVQIVFDRETRRCWRSFLRPTIQKRLAGS